MLSQYPKLQESSAIIGDAELIESVAKLQPLLGTEDGAKNTHVLTLSLEASRLLSMSDKTTRLVSKKGNQTRRVWKPEAIHYNRIIAYSGNLYPFVNDEGDVIIDSIMSRVIELVK